jgi:hypothetical protein
VVNPGSLTRQTAAQFAHQPCVYLYHAEDNSVSSVEIPVPPAGEVMTREHLDIREDRDERIEAFVNGLRSAGSFDFLENLQKELGAYMKKNKVPKRVQDKVWGALDEAR